MSSSKKLIQASAGVGGGDFYPYTIDNSARFASSSDKLTRTNSGSGSTKGCFSMWVKRSKLNETQPQLIGTGFGEFYFTDSTMGGGTYYPDAIGYYEYFSSSYQGEGTSSINSSSAYSVFRDVSAWYHVFLVWDTTLATATDRYQIWINNQRVTLTGVSNVAQNTLARWFYTGDIAIGNNSSGTKPSLCYLAEVVGVEGTAYAPTDFAQDKNGVWVPKNVSGLTFGTNGFYLDFADSSALGNDVSGNNNDFTSSGLTSSDQMTDTPTNNFATLNPLDKQASAVLSNGNQFINSAGAAFRASRGTIAFPKTGKWYVEGTGQGNSGGQFSLSLCTTTNPIDDVTSTPYGANKWGVYVGNGSSTHNVYINNNGTSSGANAIAATTNYTCMVAFDADTRELWLGYEGAWRNSAGAIDGTADPATNTNPTLTLSASDEILAPYITNYNSYGQLNSGQDSSVAGNKTAQNNADANGIGDFYYTPPTGYLALCTANLPEPTIGPNSDTLSDEHFDIALWTGTGTTQNITSLEFQPDFIWIKNRDDAAQSPWLFDAIRGVGKLLYSNLTNAEETQPGILSSFDSNGFTTDSNGSFGTGDDFVAWNWKGNGSGVSNTDGSITSTVSANQDAGFSIVTYAGTGAPMTFGHGLGQSVDFMLVKTRNVADGWVVHPFSVYGTSYILSLNSDIGIFSDSVCYTNNSTVIGFNASGARNTSGRTYVAYCFAEVEGFSSFGSYAGNGSNDGPFIYTGFRPAFVMVKQTNTSGRSWEIRDSERQPYNDGTRNILRPDTADAEQTGPYPIDILSNGFKLRYNGSSINSSGSTYIYMAFAENPFKYSNAR